MPDSEVEVLRARVAELTLFNDLAAVTAALDPALLLENALRRVSSAFQADAGAAFLVSGAQLLQTSAFGLGPAGAARLAGLAFGAGPVGRACSQGRMIHLPRVTADPGGDGWMREEEGLRVAVAVPLLAKESVLGALLLARRREEPFGEAELRLLSAIGAQLGGAVQNARLFSGTRRRVTDLEAVNALALRVLRTPPGETQRLLDGACREIADALHARSAFLLRASADKSQLRGVAGWGTPLLPEGVLLPLDHSALASRAMTTGDPAWGTQLVDEAPDGAPRPGPPSMSILLLPLISRRGTAGLVAVADALPRRFGEADIALAHAMASEAALGLENAELYAESRRRVEELSLLHEVGRKVAERLELDRILEEGARAVVGLLEATGGHVFLVDAERGELRFAASTVPDAAGLRDLRLPIGRSSLAGASILERRPLALADTEESPLADARLARSLGVRSLLATPLLLRDRPVGVLVVSQRGAPRHFVPAEVERATAVANQLAVAFDNARLYEDLRRSYDALARTQAELVRRERLAALGELAAMVAHEVRNPLAVIFNALGSLRRHLRPEGNVLMLLDIVAEESGRLNRLVGDLLDFARPPSPSLRPEPLEAVVDRAVAAALDVAPEPIRLERHVEAGLPPIRMDARLLRQAIVNVASNAVQAMPRGGTLTVNVLARDGEAVVELGDTGPGLAPGVREHIFEPFFTTRASGTGLGLALVKRILEDHHGRVEVGSSPSGGALFALHVPLAPEAS